MTLVYKVGVHSNKNHLESSMLPSSIPNDLYIKISHNNAKIPNSLIRTKLKRNTDAN
jgi:hypothetical protein